MIVHELSKYDIVIGHDRDELIRQVNGMIQDGWSPLNAPFVAVGIGDGKDADLWCQAMTFTHLRDA
jgi:hypothetical protein